LTISLNVIVTLLIIGKLLLARRRVLGANRNSKVYTSISSMLIESAMLNCCTYIAFVIPYARGFAVAGVFQEIAAYNSTVSTLLIIVRVAQGRAWTVTTTEELSTLHFTRNPGSNPSGRSAQTTNPSRARISEFTSEIEMESGIGDGITEYGSSASKVYTGSTDKIKVHVRV